jgi:hypothetical protein
MRDIPQDCSPVHAENRLETCFVAVWNISICSPGYISISKLVLQKHKHNEFVFWFNTPQPRCTLYTLAPQAPKKQVNECFELNGPVFETLSERFPFLCALYIT